MLIALSALLTAAGFAVSAPAWKWAVWISALAVLGLELSRGPRRPRPHRVRRRRTAHLPHANPVVKL